ncbi:MAG TPA: serine hydrolase domain-containing protein, partial [Gemmatimonadaceae bacterium]|nr:serine hydrolase domain-containing protein [Gemmatimonadaceae bacterium]
TQPFAAGALVSTVLDLAKWDAALYTDALLERASLERMWTPTRLTDGTVQEYGFGWQVDTFRTRRRVSHGGGISGFQTMIARFVDDRLTVIVLANLEGGSVGQLANGIAALYIPALVANAPKPIADDDPRTTRFLRNVIASMATGTGEPEWFTAEAQKFFFPDRIRDGRQMFGAFGELKSFELMEVTTRDGVRMRGYRALFGTTPLRFNFRLTEDGKIGGINFGPE